MAKIILAVMFFCLGVTYLLLSSLQGFTADTNLYLNIGLNLLHGTSSSNFDLYFSSPEKTFTAIALLPPLWPLLAGLTYRLGGSLLLHYANALFVFLSSVWFFQFARRYISQPWAALGTFLVYTSTPVLLVVVYPWTEGIGIFLFVLFVHLLTNPKSRNLTVSLLLFLLFLTRIQFFIPAYAILILSRVRDKKVKVLLTTFLCLCYEMFVYLSYHQVYPGLYTQQITTFPPLAHKTPLVNGLIPSISQWFVRPIGILTVVALLRYYFLRLNFSRLQRLLFIVCLTCFGAYPLLLIAKFLWEARHAIAH